MKFSDNFGSKIFCFSQLSVKTREKAWKLPHTKTSLTSKTSRYISRSLSFPNHRFFVSRRKNLKKTEKGEKSEIKKEKFNIQRKKSQKERENFETRLGGGVDQTLRQRSCLESLVLVRAPTLYYRALWQIAHSWKVTEFSEKEYFNEKQVKQRMREPLRWS